MIAVCMDAFGWAQGKARVLGVAWGSQTALHAPGLAAGCHGFVCSAL
jgi:hypothetical protein